MNTKNQTNLSQLVIGKYDERLKKKKKKKKETRDFPGLCLTERLIVHICLSTT